MVRHVRVMVRHVYIVPLESSHVEYPQVRLGQVPHTVRVMARHGYKSNQQLGWGPKGPNPIAPLGRRLESWPDTLAAGQAVRGTGLGQSHGFCGGGVKISNFCFQNYFRFEKNILHFSFLARRILSSGNSTNVPLNENGNRAVPLNFYGNLKGIYSVCSQNGLREHWCYFAWCSHIF